MCPVGQGDCDTAERSFSRGCRQTAWWRRCDNKPRRIRPRRDTHHKLWREEPRDALSVYTYSGSN
eukprot:2315043-Alexandrium_andersonii.AAC.1